MDVLLIDTSLIYSYLVSSSYSKDTETLGLDDIGFNALQRKSANLSLQQPLQLRVFTPGGPETASEITLSVDLLKKGQVGGKGITLDSDAMGEEFKRVFADQVLSVDQILAFDFDGGKYDIVVESVERPAVASAESSSSQQRGQVKSMVQLNFVKRKDSKTPLLFTVGPASNATNTNLFRGNFDFETVGIGGLGKEFEQIFRRAFASRIFPGLIKEIGMNHVRGILLFGPPGCGKTLIARQIGKILNAKEPKIVNGPEILDKFVGGSEEKIRALFEDADRDQKELGDASMLHVIIFDEMDAIMRTRGTTGDSTGVQDSIVNQLLSKIDGVDSLNNVLIIGMTNRKDMIDEAILRPGRLELHVEIGLPDEAGRLQIIKIHTEKMRLNNRISPEAVEKLPELAELTKNFTGAEIEGLVRNASSFAFARNINMNDLKSADSSKIRVEWPDFVQAAAEIVPAFGNKDQTELTTLFRNGLQSYGDAFDSIWSTLLKLVNQSRISAKTPLMTILLEGPTGSGKTAIAAKLACESDFPLIRMLSADSMIGYSEGRKCGEIQRAFLDAYKSELSIIFIDDIERILEYTPSGPRFSNIVLQTLIVYLKKVPPHPERRLMIVATTAIANLLEDLQLTQVCSPPRFLKIYLFGTTDILNQFSFFQSFHVQIHVSQLQHPAEIAAVLRVNSDLSAEEINNIAASISQPIGIKKLLLVLEMVVSSGDPITADTFLEYLNTVGY